MNISDNTKAQLDKAVDQYNQIEFIDNDPIQIPHLFKNKKDIEIAGIITATIAWGKRSMILNNANKLMKAMHMSPYDFIMRGDKDDLKQLSGFVHRTFNADDLYFFIDALKNIYLKYESLEEVFLQGYHEQHLIFDGIESFRNSMLDSEHLKRSEKHISSPKKGSAAKRINMFLRWMVREDARGVDFGIWKSISSADLICPLDVHSRRVAREFGLLTRKQDDWKAAKELTNSLYQMDANDPVKYDFALFGIGVNR